MEDQRFSLTGRQTAYNARFGQTSPNAWCIEVGIKRQAGEVGP